MLRMCSVPLLMSAVWISSGAVSVAEIWVLGDFETEGWDGTARSNDHVKQGQFAAKWCDVPEHSLVGPKQVPKDWSNYDRLMFWLYSAKANGQRLTILCNSEDKQDRQGSDYYCHHLTVDWQGWRLINLQLGTDIRAVRKPRGWHEINSLSIRASGWRNTPLADTVLYLDNVRLVRSPAALKVDERTLTREVDGGVRVTYTLGVTNRSAKARPFELEWRDAATVGPRRGVYKLVDPPRRTNAIAPGATASIRAVLSAAAADLKQREPLTRDAFILRIKSDTPDVPGPQVTLSAGVPLPKRRHPFLFADAQTFARAKARAAKFPWAKKQLDGIVRSADGIVKRPLDVPNESGQWSHHYVCKKCGAGLRHIDDKHVCRKCGETYTGWPYDQVVIRRIHGRNWADIRTLGLAYALTGKEAYAVKARQILLAYAEKYTTYALHNVWGRVSRSAGRIFAQTLDESVSVIGAAWGYDLIYNSPCLSAEDRQKIESKFLRQVVETIRRHDAGISNWQSWHNAGMAAVGFCLQDDDIASQAINGKSGLRFQFGNSVLSDGFWYEGTAAYHYYALSAIRYAAEAAHAAGIRVYDNAAHKSLYAAPIGYVFPDLSFPAVNDSNVFRITGQHGLYELAYTRFGDPEFLLVAHHGKRNSLGAFLWGPDELPNPPPLVLASRDFQGLGAAVLRQGSGKDQIYVHLDYGQHGGGHGHPDKLTIILFALGRQLAPDPSRLAYAAPLHRSWYRQTFAHNTVCVDQASQRPAEGKLTLFGSQPGLSVAQAECVTAYPGVQMNRTVAVTDRYVIDVFAVRGDQAHTYDWLYHNFGRLEPGLATTPPDTPPGKTNGYQHMKDVTQAETAECWTADFRQPDANVRLRMLGAAGTVLYFGTGMSENPPRSCPMVAVRRKTKRTTFISLLEPYRDRPVVTGMRTIPVTGDANALALEITRGDTRDLLLIADRVGIERGFGGVKSRARACRVTVRDDKPDKTIEID